MKWWGFATIIDLSIDVIRQIIDFVSFHLITVEVSTQARVLNDADHDARIVVSARSLVSFIAL